MALLYLTTGGALWAVIPACMLSRYEDAATVQVVAHLPAGDIVFHYSMRTLVSYDYPQFHIEIGCFLCSIAEGTPRLLEDYAHALNGEPRTW